MYNFVAPYLSASRQPDLIPKFEMIFFFFGLTFVCKPLAYQF